MVTRDEGAYILTAANGIKYLLGLDKATYEGIATAIGLRPLGDNEEVPADVNPSNSINDLIALGAAKRISCAIEMAGGVFKRKLIVVPDNKPFKGLIGKQVRIMNAARTGYDTGTIRRAVVKTYRTFK